MNRKWIARWRVLAATLCVALHGIAVAAADAARGAKVFQACAACHSVSPGEHLTGPSLAQVWERKAGTAADYLRYSAAMKQANVAWNRNTLDKWLANPEGYLPGTSMTFAGLRAAKDREDVIAYLKAVSERKAPTAGSRGQGMDMMSRPKPDLKKAPPDGQVTSIGHCRDTYTVQTADGKVAKVWEFNLRFKTDSSKDGPNPGKPVIVGAGMQGDRASVIFSSPGEISAFIKQECR